MTPQETLLYWIKERYNVFLKKEAGLPKPWSADPIFQRTYFCNVHRENDRVTRWIRRTYSPWVDHPLFEYNMVLARLLNRPESLETVGYLETHDLTKLLLRLSLRAKLGARVWGNAYVITTHGQKMDKLAYLAQVMELVHKYNRGIVNACRGYTMPPWCTQASAALQTIDGIGSFLAGQVVADLKNTTNHPLYSAPDKATFVVPGPGSIRGVGWFQYGNADRGSNARFYIHFPEIRRYVDANWPEGVPPVDNQDLQNCLCEYDKYMRIKNGTGRSKRNYDASGN